MRAKFNDNLACLSHSYIVNDVNRRVIKGRWKTTLHDSVSCNHHVRFLQKDKRSLETKIGLHNRVSKYERATKNVWAKRGKRRKMRDLGGGEGGHGFRKFATQVGRKIRNEWRSDTMQRVADGRQNRRHSLSNSVATTRPPKSTQLEPFTTVREEKKRTWRREYKKRRGQRRGKGKQKARSRSSF